MSRKRMLSPLIWEDPTFNKFTVGARLLFIGMISNADDEGYLRADIGSLKRLIFGFDEGIKKDLEGWIIELNNIPNIHFYEIDGEKYAHFLKWEIYQKQQKDRIQASAYPLCSICYTSDEQVQTKVKLGKVKLGEEKRREYLLNLPLSDKKEFLERFDLTEKQLLSKAESLNNYCLSKGRVYKDYKAFLRNALKKDFEEKEKKPWFISEGISDQILGKDGNRYYYLGNKGGKMAKIFVDLKKITWK